MKQYNKKYTSDVEVIQSNRRFIFCLVWDIEGNLLGDNILIVHVYLLRLKCCIRYKVVIMKFKKFLLVIRKNNNSIVVPLCRKNSSCFIKYFLGCYNKIECSVKL